MPVIYEPRGKAREYAPLALNLYSGCSHGCKYCYAPACIRMKSDQFVNQVSARKNILSKIENDLKKNEYDDKTILLSFTSDPYQHLDETEELTRYALLLLEEYRVQSVAVLTKGGRRSLRDLDIIARNDWWYGATVTGVDDDIIAEQELYAAPISERLEVVEEAIKRGIKTFISIEPVFDTDQALKLLRIIKDFPIDIRVGKINHCKTDIDWSEFLKNVLDEIQDAKATIYIKNALETFGDVPDEYRNRVFG